MICSILYVICLYHLCYNSSLLLLLFLSFFSHFHSVLLRHCILVSNFCCCQFCRRVQCIQYTLSHDTYNFHLKFTGYLPAISTSHIIEASCAQFLPFTTNFERARVIHDFLVFLFSCLVCILSAVRA